MSQMDARTLAEKEIASWLRSEADSRMKQAAGRRPSSDDRNATPEELKAAMELAEKMMGHPLNHVSPTVKSNLDYCDMQDRIADKLAAEAAKLYTWADTLTHSHSWIKITDDPQTLPEEYKRVDVWIIVHPSPRSMGLGDAWREVDVWRENGEWFHNYRGEKTKLRSEIIKYWRLPVPPPES